MRVKVYFNLHRKLFSVVSLEGEDKGRVIDYVSDLDLINCKFRVQRAGRNRVLREKKKNVHAYVTGWRPSFSEDVKKRGSITYNPYKYSSFVDGESEEKIVAQKYCRLKVENKRGKIFKMG